MKKKIISKLFVVPATLGLVAGFFTSIHSNVFSIAQADDVTYVQGSYCSTNTDATIGIMKFNMLPNDAPYESDSSLRYLPQSPDCVTITRNGETRNLATNSNWETITKYSNTVYALETWMMGDYMPQHGDIYTIKGDFLASDRDGSSGFDHKFMLNIKETSFIVSKNKSRSYFTALPQVVVDGGAPSMPPEADQQWAFHPCILLRAQT